MLIQRLATALILAPLFVWAVLTLETEQLQYLLLAITLLAAWEFAGLIKLEQTLQKLLILSWVLFCVWLLSGYSALVLQVAVLWWLLNLYWVLNYPKHTELWFGSSAVRLLSAPMLLVPMLLALISLHQNHGSDYFLLLMLLIWAADSGAYFVGKTFGKRKLAPKVSPGKSIEGVIGGIGFALVVMLVFLQYQQIPLAHYAGYLLLTVLTVGVSVLGDLFESLYKRVSGMKDSSNILPGHGGVLDRIDSLTAAAPVFVVGLSLL